MCEVQLKGHLGPLAEHTHFLLLASEGALWVRDRGGGRGQLAKERRQNRSGWEEHGGEKTLPGGSSSGHRALC